MPARLQAFLTVHAQGAPLPAALYAKGEVVWRDLRDQPPAGPDWGRFLVAMGQLAADHLHDERAAFSWFRSALEHTRHHGDAEVVCAATYDLAVLLERKGNLDQARSACRQAAQQAAGADTWSAATLRCIESLVRIGVESGAEPEAGDLGLLKQAWAVWLGGDVDGIDADLATRLRRTLAAFLVTDDPTLLLERWLSWEPTGISIPPMALITACADAVREHCADEPDLVQHYALFAQAAQRSG